MKKIKVLTLLVLFGMQATAQNTINGSFTFGGQTRTYSFYVPASYNPSKPAPLVLNLHGYTSNGTQQANYTNFKSIADTAGFIVAHPDGTFDQSNQRFWNYNIFGATVNDVGFLEALIDTISANYNINAKRVYSVGMSNGGYMSYYLACQSNRFAAVGSVTGAMPLYMYACAPTYVTPIIQMHGTTDPVVPYAGNTTSKPLEDVVAYWVQKNNCQTTPTITQVPNTNTTDNATATHYVYSGGTNGHTVEFYKITDGGHTWPGGTVALPASGNTCMDFNASKEIWRFFSQYERSSTTTSLAENTLNNITFYPNPTHGVFTLSGEENTAVNLSIYNLQGQLLSELKNQLLNQEIDINFLHSGNYILKIENGDFVKILKFVVN
ncbi:MAG TPA: PHB depolymerase family esterase [Crocinitomicaceae bacterium]|nr:PHB depolymerase family esterase [Crocinitomicaceae bacterium]